MWASKPSISEASLDVVGTSNDDSFVEMPRGWTGDDRRGSVTWCSNRNALLLLGTALALCGLVIGGTFVQLPPWATTGHALWRLLWDRDLQRLPCEWSTSRITATYAKSLNERDLQPFIDLLEPYTARAPPVATPVEQCQTEQNGGSTTRSIRIGPFTSIPGQWHFFNSSTFEALFPDVEYIKGYVGCVQTAEGTPIGYPPLHVHHIHITRWVPEPSDSKDSPSDRRAAFRDGFPDGHFFETHGDFSTTSDYGIGASSTQGYAKRLPDDLCVPMTRPEDTWVYAVINDVRTAPAPRMEFYLHIAFELHAHAAAPCHPVVPFATTSPIDQNSEDDLYARFLSPAQPSVLLIEFRMEAAGRMIGEDQVWTHTHRGRYDGFLLIPGNAGQYSCARDLHLQAATPRDPREAPHYSPAISLEETYQHILRHGNPICHNTTAPSTLLVSGDEENGLPAGSMFDRSGSLSCRHWEFQVDEAATLILFSRKILPPDPTAAGTEQGEFMDHFNLFFFAEPRMARVDQMVGFAEFSSCAQGPSAGGLINEDDE